MKQATNALRVSETLEGATHLLISDPDSYNGPISVEANQVPKATRVDELFTNPEKALSNSQKKVSVNCDYGFLCMVQFFFR